MTTDHAAHDWRQDGHDKIGNPIAACKRPGCGIRKIENCSTFWQRAKGGRWRDEEDEMIPACGPDERPPKEETT